MKIPSLGEAHCGLGALQSTHLLLSFVFCISSSYIHAWLASFTVLVRIRRCLLTLHVTPSIASHPTFIKSQIN
jgi:hypothetical protein